MKKNREQRGQVEQREENSNRRGMSETTALNVGKGSVLEVHAVSVARFPSAGAIDVHPARVQGSSRALLRG